MGPLLSVIEETWGYRDLRPLQAAAMEAEIHGRDSVVIMPTGGGKSLCYQAPALLRDYPTVVVSPLIALMKDQVDGLRACGVAASQIDSTLSAAERAGTEFDLLQNQLQLLFVSPERLASDDFIRLLKRARVKNFAIDEAHCISHWGHDFRPEYRQLGKLKDNFPGCAIHAYTATATQQVRDDIARELRMNDPIVMVGNFDRPNLSYRIQRRVNPRQQVLEILSRHPNEAGIIYCLRRNDVDELNRFLQEKKVRSFPYHAGLEKGERQRVQEAFAEERCDIVVATIAFGMGIDRSNIRFVIHTDLPKTIEHYQQETGRAGRDGLEAECVLLYSGGDVVTWKRILERSAEENNADPSFLPNAFQHLEDMDRYARGAVCRHRALVRYFGQEYDSANCGACDLCLGDHELIPDSLVVAQKILSCVARVQERFGVGQIVDVLHGDETEKVKSYRHDQLTTFGLLKDQTKVAIRDWIHQLIGQEVLAQSAEKYPVLKLNSASWEVMKKQRPVRLLRPIRKDEGKTPAKSKAERGSWEGVDRGLFDALRKVRTGLAMARSVPPYVIFSDATLRELAKVRPGSLDAVGNIYGIGARKLKDLGSIVLQTIRDYCHQNNIAMTSESTATKATPVPSGTTTAKGGRNQANALFAKQASIEAVMTATGRARSTVTHYLVDFIRETKPDEVSAWVSDTDFNKILAAVEKVGAEKLRPIYEELAGSVSYDSIKILLAHLDLETNSPETTIPE